MFFKILVKTFGGIPTVYKHTVVGNIAVFEGGQEDIEHIVGAHVGYGGLKQVGVFSTPHESGGSYGGFVGSVVVDPPGGQGGVKPGYTGSSWLLRQGGDCIAQVQLMNYLKGNVVVAVVGQHVACKIKRDKNELIT